MLCADLLSLHPVTVLMFFILVYCVVYLAQARPLPAIEFTVCPVFFLTQKFRQNVPTHAANVRHPFLILYLGN